MSRQGIKKNYYTIIYPRLGVLLLPTMLRQKLIIAFVSALLRPLEVIHDKFMNYQANIDISVNSQVCTLEHLINDAYDYYERRIEIRDATVSRDDFFLFDDGTGEAVMVGDVEQSWWLDNGKLGATDVDFEVVIPKGYVLSENEDRALKKLINNNKLASKRYNIVSG